MVPFMIIIIDLTFYVHIYYIMRLRVLMKLSMSYSNDDAFNAHARQRGVMENSFITSLNKKEKSEIKRNNLNMCALNLRHRKNDK